MRKIAAFAALVMSTSSASLLGAQLPVAEKQPYLLNGHNVIVILADDMAIDTLLSYQGDPGFPTGGAVPIPTPGIDALITKGIRFTNAWSNPVCSPTRATIQTGNYGFRTGIGHVIEKGNLSLSSSEVTLAELVADPGANTIYQSAAFGKWHLHSTNNCDATSQGYDFFVGSRSQVSLPYCSWEKVTCNPGLNLSMSDVYMPEEVIQSAINWIAGRPDTGGYLCYLAPQAPYELFHAPPTTLFPNCSGPGNCGECPGNKRACYDAALCALDTKISDLLATIPNWATETTIMFIGDNGTPNGASSFPAGRRKGSLYQGGINVPFIIAGKAISPASRNTFCDALVQTTDVYRTVARISGAQVPVGNGIDSVDLTPLFSGGPCTSVRSTIFAELFTPPGYVPAQDSVAIRDATYKLIYNCSGPSAGPVALYDLVNNPQEQESGNFIVGGIPPAAGTPEGDAYCYLIGEVNNLKSCGTTCP